MTDICLWSSSDSLACCSGFPLPASSVHPCWPFCIQQSAARRPGGLVEAVCKEVQHQAFCQIRPGLQVGLTHRRYRLTNKSRQGRQKEGSWERSVMHAHTNIHHAFKNTTTPSPSRSFCSAVLPNAFAGSVQAYSFHHTSTSSTLQTSKRCTMEAVCVWCLRVQVQICVWSSSGVFRSSSRNAEDVKRIYVFTCLADK